MDIIKYFTELSATIIENVIILEFLGKLFRYKYQGFKKHLFFLIALVLSTAYVSFLNYFMIFEGWLAFITIGVFVLYGIQCLKGVRLYKLLTTFLLFTIMICINVSTAYFFSILFQENHTEFMSPESSVRILALFITKFSFFILTRIFLYIFKKDELDLRKSELIAVSTLFVLSTSIIIVNIEIQIGRNQTLLNLISTICVIAINIFIFSMTRRISRENKNKLKIALQEMQISEQKDMIKDAGDLSKEIKKAEHDIKHHFISLLGTLEEKKYDEAKAYILKLLKEYETSIFKYISIENSAINGVLNFKIGRCRANNIDIKLEIETGFNEFDTIDICVLLSNLLDNAIEASLNINNPKISLIIKEAENYLCFSVKNRISQSILETNKQLKTTKKDKTNHGIGLYSVSRIVNKYDGLQNFSERKGFFIADIRLKKKLYDLQEHIKKESDYQTRQK
ncbi:MAG: GHKL domain-containing protein [Oscillospiraceae bacterium]|nr:GHKL domain-containing protein [Oscillospiraceae bacterium]